MLKNVGMFATGVIIVSYLFLLINFLNRDIHNKTIIDISSHCKYVELCRQLEYEDTTAETLLCIDHMKNKVSMSNDIENLRMAIQQLECMLDIDVCSYVKCMDGHKELY